MNGFAILTLLGLVSRTVEPCWFDSTTGGFLTLCDGGSYCNKATGVCGGCAQDSDCGGSFCDTIMHSCGGCSTDPDCNDGGPGPVCSGERDGVSGTPAPSSCYTVAHHCCNPVNGTPGGRAGGVGPIS